MTFPHGETVVRLRRPIVGVDPYSDHPQLGSWSEASEQPIELCAVAPGNSAEPAQDARTAVVTDFAIYAPIGTDVASADRLRVRGLVCEVVGKPAVWVNPYTGWAPGIAIGANIVEG